ncbi:MAG: hypothetical protein ACPG4U_14890 [Pseudomonadales bacterium]
MTTKLLDISELTKEDIQQIWQRVRHGAEHTLQGNVAWSFEGNGIRTRTTFVQAFQQLGLNYVELPNFLKTGESAQDLAGYMDAFYDLYVIRESDHIRFQDFANFTDKPVINAMSSEAHPCEVLTDAYYLDHKYADLTQRRILLWGPLTNVFKSWHALSQVLGLDVTHYCPPAEHRELPDVTFTDAPSGQFDLVITDAWPSGFNDAAFALSEHTLLALGEPELLPTPPVTVGQELLFTPASYKRFAGYRQKQLLLPVQVAIISHLLAGH